MEDQEGGHASVTTLPEQDSSKTNGWPGDALRATDVSRAFAGVHALRGVTLELHRHEVVGLIGAGAFVAFGPGRLYDGMLPVRRMPGDWWELNEEGTMLVGSRSGRALRLGDQVLVRVHSVDAPRGRIDLVPGEEDL